MSKECRVWYVVGLRYFGIRILDGEVWVGKEELESRVREEGWGELVEWGTFLKLKRECFKGGI